MAEKIMANGGARKGAGRPKGIPAIKSSYIADKIRNSIHINKCLHILNRAVAGEEVSATERWGAELGLRKTVPDLSATELSGEVARPTVIRAPKTVENSKAWLEQHGPERITPDKPEGKPN